MSQPTAASMAPDSSESGTHSCVSLPYLLYTTFFFFLAVWLCVPLPCPAPDGDPDALALL